MNSDPRVLDAAQRWFKLAEAQLPEPTPGYKFILSPERDAGVLVEVREQRRFACVDSRPSQLVNAVPSQAASARPDITVVFEGERYPLVFVGDDRIIGAFAIPIGALLLVNLGREVAYVFVTVVGQVFCSVLWSGPAEEAPDLDADAPLTPPRHPPRARLGPERATARPRLEPDVGVDVEDTPCAEPRAVAVPHADERADEDSVCAAPLPWPWMPTHPAPARRREPADNRRTSTAPRSTLIGEVIPPPAPRSAAQRAADRAPASPSSAAGGASPSSASPSRAQPVADALTPLALSEEVTAVLVRHLRHAATQIPVAKGAEVAREWLAALERACGDMSGVGDVVGGSLVLFSALRAGGHLATMPSVVSAAAAAKLLARVTPLVEQMGARRWALRVSALLDPQSPIYRKLAKHAPATCRLASTAPPAPTPTPRVRRPDTRSTDPKPGSRRGRAAELEAQLAAANAELARLRAEVATSHRIPGPGAPTDAGQTSASPDTDPDRDPTV